MKIRDLDGQFLGGWHPGGCQYVDSLDGAQGVQFQCPKCAEGKERGEEDGRRFVRGVHYVMCWFANPMNADRVPDDATPGPGRWYAAGTSLDDLTFTGPGASSIQLKSGCGWHGYVKDGDAS